MNSKTIIYFSCMKHYRENDVNLSPNHLPQELCFTLKHIFYFKSPINQLISVLFLIEAQKIEGNCFSSYIDFFWLLTSVNVIGS